MRDVPADFVYDRSPSNVGLAIAWVALNDLYTRPTIRLYTLCSKRFGKAGFREVQVHSGLECHLQHHIARGVSTVRNADMLSTLGPTQQCVKMCCHGWAKCSFFGDWKSTLNTACGLVKARDVFMQLHWVLCTSFPQSLQGIAAKQRWCHGSAVCRMRSRLGNAHDAQQCFGRHNVGSQGFGSNKVRY